MFGHEFISYPWKFHLKILNNPYIYVEEEIIVDSSSKPIKQRFRQSFILNLGGLGLVALV